MVEETDQEALLNFQAWLDNMWYELEVEFPTELPDDFPYDFSRESLVPLEALILDLESIEELEAEENRDFFDGAARYIGETLVRNLGGTWKLITDETFMYRNLPIVTFPNNAGVPESPHMLIRTTLHRRSGHFLTEVYDGAQKNIVTFPERQAHR